MRPLGRALTRLASDQEIPESLREFAERNDLPDVDIQMLASVRFRGEGPTTARRWEYIYNAIRHSKPMDAEG